MPLNAGHEKGGCGMHPFYFLWPWSTISAALDTLKPSLTNSNASVTLVTALHHEPFLLCTMDVSEVLNRATLMVIQTMSTFPLVNILSKCWLDNANLFEKIKNKNFCHLIALYRRSNDIDICKTTLLDYKIHRQHKYKNVQYANATYINILWVTYYLYFISYSLHFIKPQFNHIVLNSHIAEIFSAWNYIK